MRSFRVPRRPLAIGRNGKLKPHYRNHRRHLISSSATDRCHEKRALNECSQHTGERQLLCR